MDKFLNVDRDSSHFNDLTTEQATQLLAELEQNGKLLCYAKEHFPDYVHGSDVMKFTLLADLGIA